MVMVMVMATGMATGMAMAITIPNAQGNCFLSLFPCGGT